MSTKPLANYSAEYINILNEITITKYSYFSPNT